MARSTAKTRDDFDRIAVLSEGEGWNHNEHYRKLLLRQMPATCREALDVGCGTGSLARGIAGRCARVLALDLSPQMVRIARERSKRCANIEFQVADVMGWEWPDDRFDYIVSVATLHHLPIEDTLLKMKRALSPGGTLAILDLYRADGLADVLTIMAAAPVNIVLKALKQRGSRETPELRRAWEEHGASDIYPTLAQVRKACQAHLPGARVRRHLLWRYSLVWKKPIGDKVEVKVE